MQPTQPAPPTEPTTPTAARGNGAGSSKVMSVGAIALAIVALIAAFAIPGPAGSKGDAGSAGTDGLPGSTGPQGPPGNGTLMSASFNSADTLIGATCTNYLQVAITVPSSGTVVVQAQVRVIIEHSAGSRDLLNLQISTDPAACGIGPYTWPVDVQTSDASAVRFYGAAPQRPFPVTAGTQTYFLNGVMNLGASAGDEFDEANLVAVFYPG